MACVCMHVSTEDHRDDTLWHSFNECARAQSGEFPSIMSMKCQIIENYGAALLRISHLFFAEYAMRAYVYKSSDIKFYGTHTTRTMISMVHRCHSHPRGGEGILGGALFAPSDASKSHTNALLPCLWV